MTKRGSGGGPGPAKTVSKVERTDSEMRWEARTRAIIETAMDGFWLATAEGLLLEVNESYCRMSGYSRSELLHMRIVDLDIAVDRDPSASPLVKTVLELGEHRFETRHRRKDGTTFDVEVSVQYRPEAEGQLVMFLRDISERKRVAEALRASEERYRSMLNTSPDAVGLIDLEGRIQMVSPAVLALLRCQDEADLLGRPLTDFLVPEDGPRALRRIGEILAGLPPSPTEYTGLRPDGTTVAVEVNSQFIRGADGRPTELVLVIRDITERKRADEALRMSEERHRSILNASPDNITITDLDARIVMVSSAGLVAMGYEKESDVVGRPVSDFIAIEDRERAAANIGRMFQGILTGPEEYGGRRADGSRIELEVNGEFIRGADGQPRQIVFIARDITERKRALADLSASEARHRTILQTAMDGFWVVDGLGRIVDVNEAYCRMSGYSMAELLTLGVTDLSTRDTAETVSSHIKRIMDRGSERFESEHRRKDGSRFAVEASVQHLPIDGGRLVAFLRDMTEQKRAAAALQQSHDMIAKLTAQVPGVVYQYRLYSDGRSCFPFASPGVREIYEMTPEEVRSDATPVFDRIHPDDRERVTALIFESARTLDTFHCEFRVSLPRQGLRWRLCDAIPERMDDGSTLWHGIISDITERKQAEDAVRLSLEEKEGLLREVHHRVKNNLQVILSLLRLEASRSEVADTRRVLKDMQGRILSMAVLHETLYRSGHFGHVDLGSYLRQLAQQVFRATAGATRLNLDLSPVSVEIDQAIPCGLIVNELLTNSLKHAFTEGPEGEVTVSLTQDAGREVRLAVTDTGVGLPADFETRRGRSLGLQLVTDLTRQLHGQFTVGPGPGAQFIVAFTPALPHTTAKVLRPAGRFERVEEQT